MWESAEEPAAGAGTHIYRGLRIVERNDDGELYTVRCVVLVDGQPLPMSDRGRRHSPTGYEWGYHGSGPASLAHSLLAYELGGRVADAAYQAFKRAVVARLPRDPATPQTQVCWTLSSAEIHRWWAERQAGGAVEDEAAP